MVKRYFNVSTKHVVLPYEFIHSSNKKYIHFIHCRLIVNNILVGNASIHTDFITSLPTLNGFMSWCNVDLSKRFKWELLHNPQTFNVWFKDHAKNDIPINDGDFVLQLLLEF